MANRSSTPRDKPTAVKIALELKARINDVGASQMVESIVLRLFLSLFPLMIILVAVIGFIATKRSGGTDAVVGDIVDKLHLGGSSADLVEGMVKSAEKSRGAASGIGLVTVLLSAVSVMGAIAAACDRAWQVAKRGLLDKAMGVVWLIGTIVLFGLSGWVVKLAGMLPIPGLPTVLGLISGTVLGTALFVWTQYLMTNVKVPLRAYLPGAAVAGIGFAVFQLFGAAIVKAITGNPSGPAALAAVLALISFFTVFGWLFMISVIMNVVMWEHRNGTTTLAIQAPAIPGRGWAVAARGGHRPKPKKAIALPKLVKR